MKKLMLVVMLVSVMAMGLSGSSHAVQLQAGWYAMFGSAFPQGGYDPVTGQPYSTSWRPASSLGQSGPMVVSLWAGYPSTRLLTVAADTQVQPGVLFEDAGVAPMDREYDTVYADWESNYDASKMRLQLLRRRAGQLDELVWQETSGHLRSDGGNIWNSSPLLPGDQLVYRVIAVPEPSGSISISWGIGALCYALRRRRG